MTLAKFATTSATHVSENYKFLSTEAAHAVLADFGFSESRYRQSKTTQNNQGFQKHISIFERASDGDEDGRFNLLMLNSHDGTSSLRLEAGYFRLLCENQLGSGDVGARIIHRGDAIGKLADAIPLVINQMETFKEVKALLRDKTLSQDAQMELAKLALQLREVKLDTLDDYQLERNKLNMLLRRRYDDMGTNAWKVFNAVQENVVKGGVRLYQNKGTIEVPVDVLRKLRPLSNMERVLDVNNQLTECALQLAKAA